MLLTINTDASFHAHIKRGSYAFWAICNDFKLCKYGVFREQIADPTEAEIKAIINAVYVSLRQNSRRITRIIINTDCLFAKIGWEGWQGLGEKAKAKWRPLIKRLRRIIDDYFPLLSKKTEIRHVKAHDNTETARNWVNDWCDQKAKEAIKDVVKEHYTAVDGAQSGRETE